MHPFFKTVVAVLLILLSASGYASNGEIKLSRAAYAEALHGFWLGQCIANWTGIITEMDKIGGEGPTGAFYTRHDWGKPDLPNFFASDRGVSRMIDWVLRGPDEVWDADDDTDIEYIYQHLVANSPSTRLTGEQIRDGWLAHIWSDEESPFSGPDGRKENFLWVSNQEAFDLMSQKGLTPPATSDPDNNQFHDMIDAQLTTEIFGFFAPGRPDVALELAHLPIRTTAQGDAALAAEFYVIMYSLAPVQDPAVSRKEQILGMAAAAREHLPDDSYSAKMYDFVKTRYDARIPWESVRDELYVRYQVEEADGYDLTSRGIFCNACFAAGINFAASIVSLLYGEGDYQETVKIATLAGWDSDNPAATWGGLLGFMDGKRGIERAFGQTFSERFDIHRTRRGFALEEGIDTFPRMVETGLSIVDRVVRDEIGGRLENNGWVIPLED